MHAGVCPVQDQHELVDRELEQLERLQPEPGVLHRGHVQGRHERDGVALGERLEHDLVDVRRGVDHDEAEGLPQELEDPQHRARVDVVALRGGRRRRQDVHPAPLVADEEALEQRPVEPVAGRDGVDHRVHRLEAEHDGDVAELQVEVEHGDGPAGAPGEGGREVHGEDRLADPALRREDARHPAAPRPRRARPPLRGLGELALQAVEQLLDGEGQLLLDLGELDRVVDPGVQGVAEHLGRGPVDDEDHADAGCQPREGGEPVEGRLVGLRGPEHDDDPAAGAQLGRVDVVDAAEGVRLRGVGHGAGEAVEDAGALLDHEDELLQLLVPASGRVPDAVGPRRPVGLAPRRVGPVPLGRACSGAAAGGVSPVLVLAVQLPHLPASGPPGPLRALNPAWGREVTGRRLSRSSLCECAPSLRKIDFRWLRTVCGLR